MKRLLLSLTVGIAVIAIMPIRSRVLAQNRMDYSIVTQDSGHVALGLALRKLGVSGTFMQAPAHPDDETNALFAMFTHGMGLRSIDLQNNRGEGGQNEIGPELFRDIGVLRTSELLSAHRIDGAEQYFTRAIDYGYSFDPQEVIHKWGREEIVGDYVRLIRTLRPGRHGDHEHPGPRRRSRPRSHHHAGPRSIPRGRRSRRSIRSRSAKGCGRGSRRSCISPRGFGGRRRAGRARRRRTRPRSRTPAAARASATAPAARREAHAASTPTAYDPLLGRTYAEIGTDARSNHKCQGMGGLPPLPGFASGRGGGRPVAAAATSWSTRTIPGQKDKDETSLFDGMDTSLDGDRAVRRPQSAGGADRRARRHRR